MKTYFDNYVMFSVFQIGDFNIFKKDTGNKNIWWNVNLFKVTSGYLDRFQNYWSQPIF